MAERKVLELGTAELERVGPRELSLVAVRRTPVQLDGRARGNNTSVQLDWCDGRAEQHLHRTVVAEHLLDERGDRHRVGHQPGPQLGVLREEHRTRGDEIRRRVVAGDHEVQQVAEELLVGEPAIVDLGGEQRADEIVGRRAAPRREQRFEHGVDLGVRNFRLGGSTRDRHLGEHVTARVVLSIQTDQIADHRARDRGRVVAHHVETPTRATIGQQPAGKRTDLRFESADTTGPKACRQQRAPHVVFGWIHAGDAVEHREPIRGRRVPGMVARGLAYVGEARQHVDTSAFVEQHRLLVTQPCVDGKRIVVEGVGAQCAQGPAHGRTP